MDITPKLIEHIEKTSKAQGLKNVIGVVCKPDSVELPADSIDLAFSSLRHVPPLRVPA